jgi:hypothetical protein
LINRVSGLAAFGIATAAAVIFAILLVVQPGRARHMPSTRNHG